jgi:stress response protein YsnF
VGGTVDPAAPPTGEEAAEVVLSAERLDVATTRVPVERVRVLKRVVTEMRTLEVPVRVEQVVVVHDDLRDGGTFDTSEVSEPVGAGETGAAAGGGRTPVVTEIEVVRHEEVPVVSLRVEPAERVTVRVVRVPGEAVVSAALCREEAVVEAVPPSGDAPAG